MSDVFCPRCFGEHLSGECPLSVEREADGRWLAEDKEHPGVMAYGNTPAEAEVAVRELAERVAEKSPGTATRPWKCCAGGNFGEAHQCLGCPICLSLDPFHHRDIPDSPTGKCAAIWHVKGKMALRSTRQGAVAEKCPTDRKAEMTRYTIRHGKRCSDACGEGRHAECTETLDTCHCTYRGLHKTMHAYATIPQEPEVAERVAEKSAETARHEKWGTRICTRCNHPRSCHDDEQPYGCGVEDCECETFEIAPIPAPAETAEQRLAKAMEWLRENWPLLGRFEYKPTESVYTTIGRVAELLVAHNSRLEREHQVMREALRNLVASKEPNGYPLWFNREVHDCRDCDSEDLCRHHDSIAMRGFKKCDKQIDQFIHAALSQIGKP